MYHFDREIIPGLVHIYLPTYNSGDFLRNALQSVFSQTYDKYLLHIIDDASTDGTANVINIYAEKYPEKILVTLNEQNQGICYSLNNVMRLCKPGEFLAFFAHDDIWLPMKLERQIESLESNSRIGLVYADADIIDDEGCLTGQSFLELYPEPLSEHDETTFIKKLFLGRNFICGSTSIVTYRALEAMNFTIPDSIGFMTDHYIWMVISSLFRVIKVSETLAYYRRSTNSISNINTPKRIWESYKARVEAYQRFLSIRNQVSELDAKSKLSQVAKFGLLESAEVKSWKWFSIFALELVKTDRIALASVLYSWHRSKEQWNLDKPGSSRI